MIGQLRGTLVDKRPNQAVVEAGGVGYAEDLRR
jgi:Holliday junction resolvasome RuvABC DNA-binding subunit